MSRIYQIVDYRRSYEEREAERAARIAEAAMIRAREWIEDEEIVRSFFQSGDFTPSNGLAELIVAGWLAGNGPSRDKIFAAIGSVLVIELQHRMEAIAEQHIVEEEKRS